MKKALHTPSILIVDDEKIFRSVTARTLTEQGFETTEAANGAEAVDIIGRRSFDLALLDIRLQGMDGLDLLRVLKDESPSTECLVLTGFAELDIALTAMKSGAREFLTKPIGNEELIARVKSVLRSRDAEMRLKKLQEDFSENFLGDLLAPIESVKSSLKYLSSFGTLSEKQKSVLTTIGATMTKMESMINDMINLRSYETRSVEVERIPTNLDELVPAVCARFNSRASSEKIRLSVSAAPNIPTAEIDPNKIEQVIEHFIDRAIRHTPEGGSVVVRVSVNTALRNEECIEIAVTNSGPAVPKEELPHLFDKYKRLLAKQPLEAGSGTLKLPLCKKIVEAHRGSVAADSDGAGGTTLLFRIPTRA